MNRQTVIGFFVGIAFVLLLGAATKDNQIGRYQVGSNIIIDTTNGRIVAHYVASYTNGTELQYGRGWRRYPQRPPRPYPRITGSEALQPLTPKEGTTD